MKLFSIYKATNKINGKIYIGFDSNWPKRKNQHKSSSYKKNKKDYNHYFHKAIRKYGWEAFEWEEICCSKDGEYLLKEMEDYFIKYYDSFGKNGYNSCKGGGGCLGYKHTNEIKMKMKLPKSKEHRENLDKANKKRIGIPRSEITKEKISKSRIGKATCINNYILIDPKNIEIKVSNLKKFCRDNPQYKLKSTGLHNSYRRGKLYKGWKIIK